MAGFELIFVGRFSGDHRGFEALRDGSFENVALFSCFVDGAPAAAIVAIHQDGDQYNITPLFVSVTDAMVLTDHEGQSANGGGSSTRPAA